MCNEWGRGMLRCVVSATLLFALHFALFIGLDMATTSVLGTSHWPGFDSPTAFLIGALVLTIRSMIAMEWSRASKYDEGEQGGPGSRFM